MAGYTRQSSFADGDTITAALFNNEYNQLVNAFNNSTGHSHDGTAASGPVIGLIGDAGETSPNNKVLIDTTNNFIEFYVEVSSSSVQQLYIADGAIIPVTDSDIDIGTTSLRFKDAFIDSITTTGNVDVGGNLTVTGTTTFNGGTLTLGDADTDNIVFGGEVDSNIIPDDDNTYDLGSSSKEWKDLYIDGVAYLDAINFNGTAITSTAAELNILDGVTSTAAELNILDGVTATTAELNIMDGVTSSTAELNILDGVTSTATELNILDGVTSSTAELNILDGVTSTTAELNILDGVTSTTAELNILDGVTSTAAELNILDGVTSTTAELNILDGVTSTATELNLLDGVTATTTELNYVDVATAGTVEASKAIVVDSNKDFTGARNITITGELDAATLDISGDVDIDGTLEADAITVNGTTLAETISDTVGAMVGSNTETGISVTYDDSDNTLDFVIGSGVITNAMLAGSIANSKLSNSSITVSDGSNTTAISLGGTLTFSGTSNEVEVAESSGTVTVGLPAATQITTSLGVGGGSTNGVQISQGAIAIKNGGTQSYVDFYCESSNAHYARLQAPAHSAFSGNITATLPATTGTIALTSSDITGNAATATTLATARTIGGVSFNGSANIDLPGVNTAGNQNTTGNAATATALATARTIHGVSFDGTANIDLTEVIQDTVGAMVTGNTESNITVTYEDSDGTLDFNVTGGGSVGEAFKTISVSGQDDVVADSATDTLTFVAGSNMTITTSASGDTVTFASSGSGSGGSSSSFAKNTFAGDGSTTAFTLSTTMTNEDGLIVFIDGVYQADNVYTVSGTTLTFATAPVNGRVIEVFQLEGGIVGTAPSVDTMTGDGSDTTLALSVTPSSENQTFVTIDGVVQHKDTYSISGSTLTFSAAPPNGTKVECVTFSNVAVTTFEDADGDTKIQVEESSDEDKIRFDTGGTERMILDGSGNLLLGATSTNTGGFGSISPQLLVAGTMPQVALHETDTDKDGYIGIAGSTMFIQTADAIPIRFGTSDTERMRIDSSGNVGIGDSSPHSFGTNQSGLTISDGTGGCIRLKNDAGSVNFDIENGGGAGIKLNSVNAFPLIFATSDTERMRIDSSGNVMIGHTSSFAHSDADNLAIGDGTNNSGLTIYTGASKESSIIFGNAGTNGNIEAGIKYYHESHGTVANRRAMTFATGGSMTERMRITSSGNLLIGTTTDGLDCAKGGLILNQGTSALNDGDKYMFAQGGGSNATPFVLQIVSQNLYNSAVTAMQVGRHSGNQRSISAGGTFNASGADYAEYMKKSDNCGTIAKGDVCGVDSTGKLTDVFNDSISFVIKSTDPSYVGGDTWGDVDLNLTEEQYETERQKYDRIAFSGQVPVNITGSFNVGDYVYPQANGTAIQSVAKSNPTFEEYKLCVGKIWATQSNGKPLVAVKIG